MKHYKQEYIENEGNWLEVDQIYYIKLYNSNDIRFMFSLIRNAFCFAYLIRYLYCEQLEAFHNQLQVFALKTKRWQLISIVKLIPTMLTASLRMVLINFKTIYSFTFHCKMQQDL